MAVEDSKVEFYFVEVKISEVKFVCRWKLVMLDCAEVEDTVLTLRICRVERY
jgi:hypothetical protein